jgi:hypothetical protein
MTKFQLPIILTANLANHWNNLLLKSLLKSNKKKALPVNQIKKLCLAWKTDSSIICVSSVKVLKRFSNWLGLQQKTVHYKLEIILRMSLRKWTHLLMIKAMVLKLEKWYNLNYSLWDLINQCQYKKKYMMPTIGKLVWTQEKNPKEVLQGMILNKPK